MNPSAPYLKTNLIYVWIDPHGPIHSKPTLCFSDGYFYEFNKPELAEQMKRVQYNPPGVDPSSLPKMNDELASVGDAAMKHICRKQWSENGDDRYVWKRRFDLGVAMNSYLANRTMINGVYDYIMEINGESVTTSMVRPCRKHGADTVEAIIGAVDMDSNDISIVKEVMIRLGVHYPKLGKDADEMDKFLADLKARGVVG